MNLAMVSAQANQQFLQLPAQHSSVSAHSCLQVALHLAMSFVQCKPNCAVPQPLCAQKHLMQYMQSLG